MLRSFNASNLWTFNFRASKVDVSRQFLEFSADQFIKFDLKPRYVSISSTRLSQLNRVKQIKLKELAIIFVML